MLQVNHLGHFLLTALLLDKLKSSASPGCVKIMSTFPESLKGIIFICVASARNLLLKLLEICCWRTSCTCHLRTKWVWCYRTKSRVVVLSSSAHIFGNIDFEDLNYRTRSTTFFPSRNLWLSISWNLQLVTKACRLRTYRNPGSSAPNLLKFQVQGIYSLN